MRDTQNDLTALAQLHLLTADDELRSQWRRGMATLAASASEQLPVPLEGLSPDGLLASARIALARGLFDNLGWLSPAAAAGAMYELASALPRSGEKRELGRRVLSTLHRGDAATFVALATSLALGTRRALSGPHMQARVALALDLPIGSGVHADSLALALVSRKDLARDWLSMPSTGGLPARRLAARLLERAARDAARRARGGDDGGVRAFDTRAVREAWARLLHDRESLAWRHVAAARGLLSHHVQSARDEIDADARLDQGPGEWRRAAASLAASIAVAPGDGTERCRRLLASEIVERDPGVCGAMILGLPCAYDSEAIAADDLLEEAIARGGLYAAECLVDLRRERPGESLGAAAADAAYAALAAGVDHADDGSAGLVASLRAELSGEASTLEAHLASALAAFIKHGASGVSNEAAAALDAAWDRMHLLERSGDDSDGRVAAFRALRELDRGLLETATLSNLLTIANLGADRGATPLAELFDRLTGWLLQRETAPMTSAAVPHVELRRRQLRALLHLIDADGSTADDPGGAPRPRRLRTADGMGNDDEFAALRARRLRTLQVLIDRVVNDAPSPLYRTLCAALARACDAVTREDIGELSDVLCAVTVDVVDANAIRVLSEASMDPQLVLALKAHVRAREAGRGSDPRAAARAIVEIADALPAASSARVEAMRSALANLGRALTRFATARSLEELCAGDDASAPSALEVAGQWLARLTMGARRRLELADPESSPMIGEAARMLASALDRTLRGAPLDIDDELANVAALAHDEIPRAAAEAIQVCAARALELPLEATGEMDDDDAPQVAAPLPPWLPPGRTLGGFYVIKTLGKGAAGSVFVACRADQKSAPDAEHFALKVPEYTGAQAQILSESEFMELFRHEAGALLALPRDPNIARLVTFDAGARPKPILVMELVQGASVETVLERRELSCADALLVLDGVAQGLSTMHRIGVAHLDIKPGNIIMRDDVPVLVDFGVSGRTVRPGCATVFYGAPEVWSEQVAAALPSPTPADVYAFGCLAYELLTGETLFDGDSPIAIVKSHLTHDGRPQPLAQLAAAHSNFEPLVALLARALAPGAADRCTIDQLRGGLADLAPTIQAHAWPLG